MLLLYGSRESFERINRWHGHCVRGGETAITGSGPARQALPSTTILSSKTLVLGERSYVFTERIWSSAHHVQTRLILSDDILRPTQSV